VSQLGFDLTPAAALTGRLTLTPAQHGHVAELRRFGCEVVLVGVDDGGGRRLPRPVIARRDRNGWVEYAIRRNGSGTDPLPPVAPLTKQQRDDLNPEDLRLVNELQP
jgi:hypothetical protein